MAPWLAFGPSLCAVPLAARGAVLEWSIDPSSSLAFFFGPGFPLGLGSPSGPSATPELLFTPFFLGTSVGGGISEGTGVPFGTGVLVVDSMGFSADGVGAVMGIVLEGVEVESFDGESSLILASLTSCFTSAAGSNLRKALGDNFRVMIRLPFDDDFRRAFEAVVDLLGGAIELRLVFLMVGWLCNRWEATVSGSKSFVGRWCSSLIAERLVSCRIRDSQSYLLI